MESITIVEVRSESSEWKTGYGRDAEEAHANAGWVGLPSDAKFREVEVLDQKNHAFSESVAQVVCGYHMTEDPELPEQLKQEIRKMVDDGYYATAVQHVFDMVWDAGFEEQLPVEERKYLR